ncbi:MAG: hypothetical protein Q8P41_29260 [Pseudomonadota bacterium]|nr:hypothetical protein [Pseudomonadota bacterium]
MVLALALGCRSPAALELQPPGAVLDGEPFPLVGSVLDDRSEPIAAPIAWSSPDPGIVIGGAAARCTAPADVRVLAAAGSARAEMQVQCRPGARLVAPQSARVQVGAALDLDLHVDAGGPPVDLPIALSAAGPEVEVTSAGARAALPGRTQLVARAGPLSATIDVQVVEPFRQDQVHVVASGPDGDRLVTIDAAGQVTQRLALPGLERRQVRCAGMTSCVPSASTVIDTATARVAWLRHGDGAATVVASDAPGRSVVLGTTHPEGGIGVVGGSWAWGDPEGDVIHLEDGSTRAMPGREQFVPARRPQAWDWPIRFAGGDAAGNACVIGGRKLGRGSEGWTVLCVRDGVWVAQPPPTTSGFQEFGGLVDGGRAIAWMGNYKYDCALQSWCGWVVPVEGIGSPWPSGRVSWSGSRAVAAGRVAELEPFDPYDRASGGYLDPEQLPLAVRISTAVGDTPARVHEVVGWKPVAMSPDGSLLLVRRAGSADLRILATDELLARQEGTRAAAVSLVPLSEPLAGVEAVDWR